jgi:drug/metabolite transporter (DMT)-like permease
MFAVRTGILAGLLFAVVPMITRYGQEARPYAFATMFALLATLWLIRALDKPSLRNWTLYGLAIAATGFSHLVAMAVLAGHVWLVFLAKKRGDRIAHYAFAGAALLGLSITFPMVAQGTGQSGQIAWNVTTTKDLTQFPDTLFGSWITGGAVMAFVSLAFSERVPESVPTNSLLAWLYLATFGSLLAYTAYTYLLANTRPAIATSYAYVNPIVAVGIGAAFGGEHVGPEVFVSVLLIAGATLLVMMKPKVAPVQPAASVVES